MHCWLASDSTKSIAFVGRASLRLFRAAPAGLEGRLRGNCAESEQRGEAFARESAPKGTRKRLINDNSKSNQRELSRRRELFGRLARCLFAQWFILTANTIKVAGVPNGTA